VKGTRWNLTNRVVVVRDTVLCGSRIWRKIGHDYDLVVGDRSAISNKRVEDTKKRYSAQKRMAALDLDKIDHVVGTTAKKERAYGIDKHRFVLVTDGTAFGFERIKPITKSTKP